jgi:hypothetical protein
MDTCNRNDDGIDAVNETVWHIMDCEMDFGIGSVAY